MKVLAIEGVVRGEHSGGHNTMKVIRSFFPPFLRLLKCALVTVQMHSSRRRPMRLLLPVVASIALLVGGTWFLLSTPSRADSPAATAGTAAGSFRDTAALSSEKRMAYDRELSAPFEKVRATHLIIVPGHGVFFGLDANRWADETQWALEPFQRGFHGQFVQTLARHIAKSIALLKESLNTSLVVFSGGESRPHVGPKSEALSYYLVAEANNFFQEGTGASASEVVRPRLIAEEYARDSYENILFSICRFHEVTGSYPERISVVGFAYKRRRFVELHRQSVRFPVSRFSYYGIDVAAANRNEREGPPSLSDERTYRITAADPYLCVANRLVRHERNPSSHSPPYLLTCPALEPLLLHCGPQWFSGPLPWDTAAAAP